MSSHGLLCRLSVILSLSSFCVSSSCRAEKELAEARHMSREKSWMMECFRLEKEKKKAERAAASTAALSGARGASAYYRGSVNQMNSSSSRSGGGRGGGGTSECAGCLWKEKELRDLNQKLRKCEAEKSFCEKVSKIKKKKKQERRRKIQSPR